jgi:hypothetical protein
MQPRDLFRRRRPGNDSPAPDESTGTETPDATLDPDATVSDPAPSASESAASIRDRQKQRRDVTRQRHAVSTFLGTSDEITDPALAHELDRDLDELDDDDEDDDGHDLPTPALVTGQVWIVFRSVSWKDADATLRESDTLVSVFGSEASAKLAVTSLDRSASGDAQHWYQPYTVIE